jgi:ubiquinone/menaquinone biosynthesis C-methylase UbiE
VASRNEIIGEYYNESYNEYLFSRNDLQSKGINWFEKQIEKFFEHDIDNLERVLELGGGSGEHLQFLTGSPSKYYSLDMRPVIAEKISQSTKVIFVQGDAEKLPFEDAFFDRVFSTCLLHHVNDPLQVMNEARRVTKPGGEIAFLLPTDPGILNSLIKRTISYRKLRKISNYPPELIYALDHQNSVSKIIHIFDFVFEIDRPKKFFRPFFIHSVNWNLAVVLKANKRESEIL